jgi:hypothetical protein
MNELLKEIEIIQLQFQAILNEVKNSGGVTEEQYINYLSMQYHLTKDVQRYFYNIASHSDFIHSKGLRNFLVNFANEEEPHYMIAANDLKNMNQEVRPVTLDVKLWHSYFRSTLEQNPYLRLGAVTILENVSGKSGELINEILFSAKFLNPRNTRFFAIHKHDSSLPHGDQILEAIVNAKFSSAQLNMLTLGAQEARIMYSRMVNVALGRVKQVA